MPKVQVWIPGPSPASSDGSFFDAGQHPDLTALLPTFLLLSFCLVFFPGTAIILLRLPNLPFPQLPVAVPTCPGYQVLLPRCLCLSSPTPVSINANLPSDPDCSCWPRCPPRAHVSFMPVWDVFTISSLFLMQGTEGRCTTCRYNRSRYWVSFAILGIFSDIHHFIAMKWISLPGVVFLFRFREFPNAWVR